jgi:predicted pyridoxine 5'-phosphate oxidase superfamily flavin-nucleotide-binding protein
VQAAERRIRELGGTVHHDGIVPHAEGMDSGGVFFEDPDGIRLEIVAPSGAGQPPRRRAARLRPAGSSRGTGAVPWHEGERAVQQRAGEAHISARAGRTIGETMPEVARQFLATQPMVVVGSAGPNGRVWSSLLSGPPGFTRALDERTVVVEGGPATGDPLVQALASPRAPLAMIAVEPQTRRRMRLNGTAELRDGHLQLHTEQVFANCPKYIQTRAPSDVTPRASGDARVRHGTQLTASDRKLIAEADTFFVASAHPDGSLDVSRRGGNPGFVRVLDARHLAWPDYAGNSFYMTLGNLELNPRAGLLVLDWERGDTLQLSGSAVVDWSPGRAETMPGARRVVDFTVEQVVHTTRLRALRWRLETLSRFNPG